MTRRSARARSAQEWGAVLPQWLGMAGLVFCAVFWAATQRVEPLLVSAFVGLIAVGTAGEAATSIRRTNQANSTDRPVADPPAGATRRLGEETRP